MSSKRQFDLFDISRYRDQIYGFAILWIVLMHAIAWFDLSYARRYPSLRWLNEFIGWGNMGVDIFLFCSGICLYFSWIKNRDIGAYMKRRLIRIWLPVLVIWGPLWAYQFVVAKWRPSTFLMKIFMLDFWVGGANRIWFISFILVCYLLYPYIFAYLFPAKGSEETESNELFNSFIRYVLLMAVTMVLTIALKHYARNVYDDLEIGITRIPVFLTGCFFGKLVYEKKRLPWCTYPLMIAVLIAVIYVLHIKLLSSTLRRWINMPGAISLTAVLIMIFRFLKIPGTGCQADENTAGTEPRKTLINVIGGIVSAALTFIGTISINLYCSHIMLRDLFRDVLKYDMDRLYKYLIMIVAAIVYALLAEILIKKIRKTIEGRAYA